MKAVVFTLGCKVNEAESSAIEAGLEEMGVETSKMLSFADIYILNTCAVTAEAERKSRQLVARVKKFNANAKIFVCGCASEKDKKPFEEKGVTFVCGARRKQEVLDAVAESLFLNGVEMPYPKNTRTRAFIKIQDGCNNFCSYCIIPYLRGRERSRSIEDILYEVESCACPEIVLNGINISSFGGGLEGLINALRGVDKRIRLGSLEGSAITGNLLSELKNLKDFAPQFHLSLQSGSDAVLKAMNRRYTRSQYLEKCEMIYSAFPDSAITTDIIAGFATETEKDFEESLSIIKEAGLARVHAFAYSPREGTAAYRLKDLPQKVKSERLHRLLAAAEEARIAYADKFLCTERTIIAEDKNQGYTDNYIRVYSDSELIEGNKYKVKLLKHFKDGVTGTV